MTITLPDADECLGSSAPPISAILESLGVTAAGLSRVEVVARSRR